MIDLHGTMVRLAKVRPVFHSEADFQHALAWQLREEYPHLSIRLEYRRPQLTLRGYIDVWASTTDEPAAIELKLSSGHWPVRLCTDGNTKHEPIWRLVSSLNK